MSTASAQIQLTLTPSNYNGFQISCFGASTGNIDLTISGGVPPYTILWSTNDTIEDLSGLPAGYYNVRVTDSDSVPIESFAEITLVEPRRIEVDAVIHKYPNDYNISVFGACNGMLEIEASEGVAPYTWLWSDGSVATNRSALCAGKYLVTVTDANNCRIKDYSIILIQPERSDWQLGGNEGTAADQHFLGTVDTTDLVLKTTGEERLRITSGGQFDFKGALKIDSASTDTVRYLYVDQGGFLRTYGPNSTAPAPAPDWNLKGNDNVSGTQHFIGTLNAADLVFKTTSTSGALHERMRITSEGQVGIGTDVIPSNYALVVNGTTGFREVYVKLSGPWPDYVFDEHYQLMPLEEVEHFYKRYKHLPGMPSASEISTEGQNLGEIQRMQQEKIEELYLYTLILKEELDKLRLDCGKLQSIKK